ncbi:hypothetical protein [Grimontia sp. NTOU-MAR1]|uniref:hypothetical protein n=1 Tax=Grimontia sp. NTOU-MAR1 TaxID=3111011 RepID=UPI002DB95945|nr:hypothetical protein [Grimontia sp. NTOU-MAR1]WRV98684.1 hypothetical protein VP504_04405 [Grimontia sp. NTOU-MAR1]
MIAQLKSAYLGELYGIAFFQHFIEQRRDGDKQHVWQLLLDVELLTAKRLREGFGQLGELMPETDEDKTAKGVADAGKWVDLPWQSLIDTMVDWVAPYQKRYQEATNRATEHFELFELVSDHENAIYDFLLAEQKGESNSVYILSDFLRKYQA